MDKINFLALCLVSIILMAATCTDVPQNQNVNNDCIDKSKINPNGICTMQYEPVCGCDGKTYSNDCVATNAGVTKWEKGACEDQSKPSACIDKSKINPNQPCTKQYEPVCGCDGKEYGNPCMAEKAGVTKWEKGKCPDNSNSCIDKSKINPKQPCTKQYEPVCGCDGKEYSNPCMAEKAGVTKWEKGKCSDNSNSCIDKSKINPTQACTREYDPVCGCDGKTYSNPCEAKKAGVTKWEKGKCATTGCIDKSKIKKSPCPDLYQPVCGCDNKTYPNSCDAKNNGLTSWKKGKC